MSIEGFITLVESAPQGAVALSWIGTAMTVADASALSREGGQLTVDGGATLYSYAAIDEGATEDDPDVVSMVDSAPDGWPGSALDPDSTGQVWVQVWPEVLDVVATVQTPEGDVQANVPHALRPLLTAGVRNVDDRELVTVEDGQIDDVIGRRGEVGLDGLAEDVQSDIATGVQASSDASAAQSAADAAQSVADQAQSAASTAQTAADAAQSRADAAKQAADAAAATAGASSQQAQDAAAAASTAQQIANAAKENAAAAQSAADAAQTTATNAANAAAAAQSTANDAATAAAAAQDAADAARAAAGTAQASADGKNVVKHSTAAASASVPGMTAGDMWLQHQTDPNDPGSLALPVLAWWMWSGSTWVSQQLTGAVLTALDAGTITVGALSGISIYSPGAGLTPRTQIVGSTLEVVRSDGEDGEVVTTRLGGEDEDQLLIYGADGALAAGMSSDGIITGESLDVRSDVSVSGTSLLQMIADRPQGIIAAHRFPARTPDVGTTETATVDLAFTAQPGRLYRFRVTGNFRASDSVRPTLRFRLSQGGDDESAAPQPTVSSPQIGSATVIGPTAGLIQAHGEMEYTLITPATDPVRRIRVLLTIQGNSTTNAVFVYDGTEFTVSDEGTCYKGTFNDGNYGASIVQTWTKTYPLSWVYLWRNGSGQPGVTTPQQGYATRALGVGHPGGQWYTMVGWPTQLATDLTGAQSIANIQFYLNCYDTMNSGFIPRISFHANTSNPSTPTGVAPYDSNLVTKGAEGWMNIRADRIANIANGTWKGLTFGLNVGQDLNYAGCFSMLDPSGMSFRATYTK